MTYPGMLNSAVFPNALMSATAGTVDGKPAAQFVVPQINEDRWLTRIILQTRLTAADLAGGLGGPYWDLSRTPAVQAPFYMFLGSPGLSNMVEMSMMGAVNVGEYLAPIKIPGGTELWGVWPGVNADAVSKCQATLMFSGVR